MKKILVLLVAAVLMLCFSACGETGTVSQGDGVADASSSAADTALGDYQVEIKSCRLAEDYEGKSVVIVNYGFTNNGDESAAFYTSLTAEVFQDGIGLNESYFVDENANYDESNQSKEIKTGATLDVEVAYELNDTTTDIEVEVSEWISFSDKKLTKTFKIAE